MRKVPQSSSPGQTHMKNVKERIKGRGGKKAWQILNEAKYYLVT